MKQREFDQLVSDFKDRMETFDGFYLQEYDADGSVLVSGCADTVMWVRSAVDVTDVDDDGVPEHRIVHWINLRLGTLDDERPHVRKIVSVSDQGDRVILTTDAGRRLILGEIDDDDADLGRVISSWQRLRQRHRAGYDVQTANLMREALAISQA